MSPRADAVRNRAKVLAVAADLFATQGVSVSTEAIARAAGVGIGTIFRHFPTKEALLRAVLEAHFEALAVEAEHASAADDPGAALRAFLLRAVEQSRIKTAFAEAGPGLGELPEALRARFRAAVTDLLTRAQRAGAVRTDIDTAQLLAVLAGAVHAALYTADDTVSALILDCLHSR